MDLSRYEKLELRAITNSSEKRDSSVMMSSAMPSPKWSASPLLRLLNGRTAIEGLSGSASAGRVNSLRIS